MSVGPLIILWKLVVDVQKNSVPFSLAACRMRTAFRTYGPLNSDETPDVRGPFLRRHIFTTNSKRKHPKAAILLVYSYRELKASSHKARIVGRVGNMMSHSAVSSGATKLIADHESETAGPQQSLKE